MDPSIGGAGVPVLQTRLLAFEAVAARVSGLETLERSAVKVERIF